MTRFCAGKVAAVDQDVGVGGKRTAPLLDGAGVGEQRVEIQFAGTQLYRAGAAVGNQVDGVDVLPLAEKFADLGDAIAFAVEQHDFDGMTVSVLFVDVGEDFFVALYAQVDENDFQACVLGLLLVAGSTTEFATGIQHSRFGLRCERIRQRRGEVGREQEPGLEFLDQCAAREGGGRHAGSVLVAGLVIACN